MWIANTSACDVASDLQDGWQRDVPTRPSLQCRAATLSARTLTKALSPQPPIDRHLRRTHCPYRTVCAILHWGPNWNRCRVLKFWRPMPTAGRCQFPFWPVDRRRQACSVAGRRVRQSHLARWGPIGPTSPGCSAGGSMATLCSRYLRVGGIGHLTFGTEAEGSQRPQCPAHLTIAWHCSQPAAERQGRIASDRQLLRSIRNTPVDGKQPLSHCNESYSQCKSAVEYQ